VRDTTFTVSWVTDQAATGEVHYGTDSVNLNHIVSDDRGAATSDDIHYVTLLGLLPDTLYYFDVVSVGTTNDNGGAHYGIRGASARQDRVLHTVTTGRTLDSPPPSDTIYGQVLEEDGVSNSFGLTPAEGAVVYVDLLDDDGSGSPGQAAALSSLADSDGYWHVGLGSARTADLGNYFSYSASGDRVQLTAQGAGDGTASKTVDTADDSPAPPMVLVPCTGDFDGDHKVTVTDIQDVASRWGQPAGPPYDSDDDGVITVSDISDVVSHWRESCG